MEKQKPLISVIMPVYNGQKTVAGSINSILEQTYNNLELIVIDDGSTDKSGEIINNIDDNRLNYKKIKHTGAPTVPRNMALKMAKGDFIAFCDQDDIWYPEKIEKQINAYNNCEQKEKIGIIFCSTDQLNISGEKIGENPAPFDGYLEKEDAFKEIVYGNFITACSAVVPKNVFRKVGLLDTKLHGNDEYDLWLRITNKYGVLAVPEFLCAWLDTGTNFSKDKTKLYRENEKIFNKMLAENPEDKTIKLGYSRNINRIFTSQTLTGDFNKAREYKKRLLKANPSLKARIGAYLFTISPSFTQKLMKYYQDRGKISL